MRVETTTSDGAGEDDEPVGGLLALGGAEELALGDPGDYDELALGEAYDEPVGVALDFGASAPTGAWDLGGLKDLVVQEVGGDFGGDGGSNARDDVMVMEEEYDPDAEVVMAVFQGRDGRVRVERRVKRQQQQRAALVPYGVIAGVLLVLGAGAMLGVVAVVVATLLWPAQPQAQVVPLTNERAVDEDRDRPLVREAEQLSADEILERVLDDEPPAAE